MILVFDLDETLIHSHEYKPIDTETLPVYNYHVEKRPYVDVFLEALLDDPFYKVGIWSAGEHNYVWEIMNWLVPGYNGLYFIQTRNDCSPIYKDNIIVDYVKPLSHIHNLRELEEFKDQEIVLIDNKPGVTPDGLRHILINDFEGDKDDDMLVSLYTYLTLNKDKTAEWLAANWETIA